MSINSNSEVAPTLAPDEPVPGESGRAFGVFKLYLALGPTRNLAKAARAGHATKQQACRWAKLWRWKERAAEYNAPGRVVRQRAIDAVVARSATQWAEKAEESRSLDWQVGEELRATALRMLSTMKSEEVSLAGVVKALELASQLTRRASGLSEAKAGRGAQANVQVNLSLPSNGTEGAQQHEQTIDL